MGQPREVRDLLSRLKGSFSDSVLSLSSPLWQLNEIYALLLQQAGSIKEGELQGIVEGLYEANYRIYIKYTRLMQGPHLVALL